MRLNDAIKKLDAASTRADIALSALDPMPDPVTIPGMAPWLVALLRAVGTALFAGGTVFLGTWTQTDSPKLLAVATLSAMLPVLAARFGIEATVDTARAERAAK